MTFPYYPFHPLLVSSQVHIVSMAALMPKGLAHLVKTAESFLNLRNHVSNSLHIKEVFWTLCKVCYELFGQRLG